MPFVLCAFLFVFSILLDQSEREMIKAGLTTEHPDLCADVQQNKIRAHVHGHTHQGQGQTSIGATRILNAGSVRYASSFAFLTLRFSASSNKWAVVGSSLHRFVPEFPSDAGDDVCGHEDLITSGATCVFSFDVLALLIALSFSTIAGMLFRF